MSGSQQRLYTEQELTKLLRSLPQAITIMERENGTGYVWTWLASRGEASTFLEALENALTHIQISWTECNEL